MTSCELCGKDATTKAKIEGVILSVCSGCATLGHELGETPRQVLLRQQANRPMRQSTTETFLATDYTQRLRKARQRMGLNEKEAAQKLNIKENELLHYESGKIQPNETIAKKLEKFYNIKLYESL